ncbi:unnamed protein product [Ixodes persulcatus]
MRKPNKRNPQLRVLGVDPDILPAELLTTVKSKNEGLDINPEDFTYRTAFKEKSGSTTYIFEVKARVCDMIKSKYKLRLGWTFCAVTENFYVPRCIKCCQYGHTKARCNSQTVFYTICAGSHPTSECQVTCYDQGKCRAFQNRRVNANRPSGASEGTTLKFQVDQIRAQTDYPW